MFFLRGGYSRSLDKDVDYGTGNKTGGMTVGAGVDYKFNENMGITFVQYNTKALG